MSRKLNERFGNTGLAFAIAFLLFAPLAQAHQSAQQFSPPPQAPGYALTFDDEFSIPDLSPDGAGAYNWYPGVWFFHVPAPAADFVETQSLLDLIWNNSQSSTETSIETLSADKSQYKTFRYGYFEVRMKWNAVTGAWPAFWMTSIQDATGQDYYNGLKEAGELDVFEGQGAQPHTFIGTIHDWKNGLSTSNPNSNYILPVANDFSQFHTYGVLWQPGQVTWYYDNQPLMSAPTPAIFDKQDYFLVLGMQEGVNWQYGNRTGVTADKMDLKVDWVRVWQQ